MCHLPAGPHYHQEPSNQAQTTSPVYSFLLPGVPCSTPIKVQRVRTEDKANIQPPILKINSNPTQDTMGHSGIEIALKDYGSWFPKCTKEENTSEMKKLWNQS